MRALALVLLAACGGKSESATAGSDHGSAAPKAGSSAVDAVTKSSPIDGDPAWAVVERAFKDKRPAFPLLSKDGSLAAVDIVTPIGQTGGSTYSVAFIAAGADAWSGTESEPITLVDAKLVHLLLETMDTAAVARFDIDSITTQARGITDRLREGEFRRFDSSFDAIGERLTAGPFRIQVTTEATKAITIAIGGASEQVQPVPMGRVGDIDCVAAPVVKRVFSDAGRRRLLLHISWQTTADQCDRPDDKYRLF